jgi:hypothetical protein
MHNPIDYKQLAAAMMAEQSRYKAADTPPTGIHSHGPGGLFSALGLSRPLFSAMQLPMAGLQARLPVRPSQDTNPLYGIITGQTATSGDEPTAQCDDPPTAGTLKLCTQSLPFGLQARQTPSYDLREFGQRVNRGEFMDFQIFGNPADMFETGVAPTIPNASPAMAAQQDTAKLLAELAVSWSRDFARELYNGNPASNTAGRQYFNGLDILINNGRKDAVTETSCPAANSLIYSFGDNAVNTNGDGAVRVITKMYQYLRHTAAQANLNPVRWVLAMPFGLFYALTDVWPCSYMTFRCANNTSNTNASVDIDTAEANRMRDGMRGDLYSYTGQYLLIDGQQVPVIIDDAIPYSTNAGGIHESDIYFVPMTVKGATRVTYLEYFNFDVPGGAMQAAGIMAGRDQFYTSDGGRFLWAVKPNTNYCVQLLASAKPRLVLLTPQIAARMTNVGWTSLIMERDWDPTGTYFYDGGVTTFAAPSYFDPTG